MYKMALLENKSHFPNIFSMHPIIYMQQEYIKKDYHL